MTIGAVTNAIINANTTPTTTKTTTSAVTTAQKKADKEIDDLISKIRSLNSSSYEVDQALQKIDADKIDGKQMLRLQNAFNERQKMSDLFSNIMKSLHEMQMNVVRNMKLN